MALFVVACGGLLMLGGAASLLLGFDIVMTERGAAMTIGGVVALSGGVIAVGIGLALVRMNQIIRALEARTAKPVRAGASERPVVPLASEEGRLHATVAEPGAPDHTTLPAAIRPQPVPAGGSLMPTAATAGLAAGAVALGAASVLGRSRTDEPGAAVRDPESQDAAIPEPAVSVEEPPRPSLPVLPAMAEEAAEPELTSDAARKSIALPLDLEEELSRALAETSIPPEPVTAPATNAPLEEDRSFEAGLSKLLGRSARPPALPSERASPPDLTDLLGQSTQTADSPGSGTAAGEDSSLVAEQVTIETPVEDPPNSLVPEQPEVAADDHLLEADEELREEQSHAETEPAPASSETDLPEPALGEPQPDERNDDDIFNDVRPAETRDVGSWGETPVTERAHAHPASPPAPEAPVLGTYTIGGRTYRMFGDGSVEAVSEGGEIERFASMDELRKHLARA